MEDRQCNLKFYMQKLGRGCGLPSTALSGRFMVRNSEMLCNLHYIVMSGTTSMIC